MTLRQLYEYVLIECNKKEAPPLLLEDFNYFFNKAINLWINRMYNVYEINQQKSDDLRILKSSTSIIPILSEPWNNSSLLNKTYEAYLPDDYLHILGCIAEYTLKSKHGCNTAGNKVQYGIKRMTSDMWPQLFSNYYFKPSYKNPYFYINSVNIYNSFPTLDNKENIPYYNETIKISNKSSINPNNGDRLSINGVVFTFVLKESLIETDVLLSDTPGMGTLFILFNKIINCSDNRLKNLKFSLSDDGVDAPRTVYTITIESPININVLSVPINKDNIEINSIHNTPNSFVNKIPELRYGNRSRVRMEIRYGDDTVFQLSKIYVDYIKSPQFVKLTEDQIDEIEDNSQILEFQDYVCQELVNDVVKLIMENASDPRLQTHIPINQSIPTPGQQTK